MFSLLYIFRIKASMFFIIKMISSNTGKLNKDSREQQVQRIIDDKRILIKMDQKQNLMLIIENEETYQCYELLIDEIYLSNDQNLSRFFVTPKDLHFTFVQLIETVKIIENKMLLLTVSFQPSKINLIKQFEFKLELKPERTVQMLKGKVKRYKEENEEMLKQIQFQRQKRVKDKQSYQQQIDEHSEQNNSLKKKIRQLQSQLVSIREELNKANIQNGQLIEQKNHHKLKIGQLIDRDQSNFNKINHLQSIVKSFQSTIVQYKNLLNQLNPHYYSFHYSLVDQKSLSIIKKNENGWNNFITKALLPRQDPLIFYIKVKNTKDGSICLGICNSAIFGSVCLDCSSSITYFCRDGSIFDKGTRRFGGLPILSQCFLRIEIDWKKNIIGWFKQNQRLGEASLQHFRKDEIYLTARMFWKSDEIEISL